MKLKLVCLLFLFTGSITLKAQTLTLKKTCDCTMDGNISSTVKFSSNTMYPNKAYKAYVTVLNTGTCGWDEGEVELRVKIIRCPSGSACQRDELIPTRWDVNNEYRPKGESEVFIYDFEGPEYTGKFQLSCQVFYQGRSFGDAVTYTVEIRPGK
ncbi:MAG TPA: hypothetical protein PLX74_10070 [Chitinophagaceae bacterium]|nr:hypothetical protein [Chitinophagaceae bacterium]